MYFEHGLKYLKRFGHVTAWWRHVLLLRYFQDPDVQTLDSTIHQINYYPEVKY